MSGRNLCIYFKDLQIIVAVGKSEFALKTGIDTGNIMFIHIHPHFKTGQYINLSQPCTGSFGLSDFRIQGSQLSINGRPDDQIPTFLLKNGQRFLGSLERLFILSRLLVYRNGILFQDLLGKFFLLQVIIIIIF